MLTKIQKWGNSQGLRFPKTLLEQANIAVGDDVDITVEDGRIIVAPARHVHGRYDIRDLVARMPNDYEAQEVDWGLSVGREAW